MSKIVGQTDNTRMVKEAAERMGYIPNSNAIGLRTKQSSLVGVIVPDIGDDFFALMLSGIEKALEEHGYSTLIVQTNENSDKEKKAILSLYSHKVDGLLISYAKDTNTETFLKEFYEDGLPTVVFDRVPKNSELPVEPSPNFAGGKMIGKHFADRGYKSMLYYGVSPVIPNDALRTVGFINGLVEAGLDDYDCLYCQSMDYAQQVLSDYLKNNERPRAIFCYNDHIAAEVLRYLKSEQIKVPEEVAIAGFDNRYLGDVTDPQLTTIDHFPREQGRRAAELLIAQMKDTPRAIEEPIEPILIVRESS
ncbi:MAG: LacI family DNA-binding transcriptional regulator [Cyclobacteriaceae bacterium]|nr:LacI family DNA-binding transcriptional regulator [Cyclobacteriaceae bacterium HetDA_MAG_MS6]